MAFASWKRNEIRERSGYYCQVCGEWHPPHTQDTASRLEAHSLDRTHADEGLAVCSHTVGTCHQTLHNLTNDPEELRRVSLEAMEWNGLAVAIKLTDQGVDEKTIRRVVGRICNI